MQAIEQYIEQYFGIGGHGLSKVADLFELKTLEKGDFLLKINQHNAPLCFVKEGFFRIYAASASGDKEITQWISPAGSFVTDLSSLIFDSPARCNIQALTPVSYYAISKENYNNISTYVPKWDELEKLFLAKCFITLEQRVFGLLSLTSEERYKIFFEQNPTMFNQVPLQYIASMLGMTPETFSRIRKKLSS